MSKNIKLFKDEIKNNDNNVSPTQTNNLQHN